MPVTDSGRRTLFRLTTLLGALSLSDAAITASLAIHLVRAVGAQGLPLLALRFIPPVFSGAVAPVVLRYIGVARALQLVPIARAAMLEAAGIAVACRAPLAVVLLLLSADVMVGQFFRPALATILPGVSVSIAELARATARLGNAKSLGAFLGTTIGAFLGARTGLESTALCVRWRSRWRSDVFHPAWSGCTARRCGWHPSEPVCGPRATEPRQCRSWLPRCAPGCAARGPESWC